MSAHAHPLNESDMLTIAELARQYDLPESTARYYCKRFVDYLPHVGQGKRRRYRPEAVDVFSVILREMKNRKDAKAVEAVLVSRAPRGEQSPVAQKPSAAPTQAQSQAARDRALIVSLIQTQTQSLDRIAQVLDKLSAKDDEIHSLQRQLAAKDALIDALQSQVERVASLQESAEAMHQQDLDQIRSWLGRLAKEQAKKA